MTVLERHTSKLSVVAIIYAPIDHPELLMQTDGKSPFAVGFVFHAAIPAEKCQANVPFCRAISFCSGPAGQWAGRGFIAKPNERIYSRLSLCHTLHRDRAHILGAACGGRQWAFSQHPANPAQQPARFLWQRVGAGTSRIKERGPVRLAAGRPLLEGDAFTAGISS